jgi:hypothetical protein
MTILKQCFWVILSFAFLSCSNETVNQNEFQKFPITSNFESETFIIPPVFYEPTTLLLIGTKIVVVDNKSEFIFHIFDAKDFSYNGSYIRRGRGPNEEQEFFNPNMRKIRGNAIIYQTPSSIKTVEFTTLQDSVFIGKTFELFENIINFQRVFMVGNIFYGYSANLGLSSEFHGYDSITKSIFEFGAELGPYIEEGASPELENKRVTVKPDESLFAASYLYFPIIRIFNSTDGLVKRDIRYVQDFVFPDAMMIDNPTTEQEDSIYFYYTIVNSTQNYIYALYYGKTIAETDRSIDRSNTIHVYDWYGNPVKEIILDREVFSFDVSEDDSFIIASSMNYPDRLFKFNLNH